MLRTHELICLAGTALAASVAAAQAPTAVPGLLQTTYIDRFETGLAPFWEVDDGVVNGSNLYNASNVTVSGGVLRLGFSVDATINNANNPGQWSSYRLRTPDADRLSYGYHEYQLRLPDVQGVRLEGIFASEDDVFDVGEFVNRSTDTAEWVGNFIFQDFSAGSLGNGDVPLGFDPTAASFTVGLRLTEAGTAIHYIDGVEIARTDAGRLVTPDQRVNFRANLNESQFGTPGDLSAAFVEVDDVVIKEKQSFALLTDDFDYAGSINGESGGIGGSAWAVTSGSAAVEGLGGSIGAPDPLASPFTPTGDRLVCTSPFFADRPLDSLIDFAGDTETFIAVLMTNQGDGSFELGFRTSPPPDATDPAREAEFALRLGIGDNGDNRPFMGGTLRNSFGSALATGESCLFIIRIASEVGGGNTTVEGLIVREGGIIPATVDQVDWQLNGANQVASLNFLTLDHIAGAVDVDEIRVASTYADAVSGLPSSLDAYEGFDYSGRTDIDGGTGGSGLNFDWLVNEGDSSNTLSNDDTSIGVPMQGDFGDTLVVTDGVAERALGFPISLDEDVSYYASFRLNKDAASDVLLELTDAAGNPGWRAGLAGVSAFQGGVDTLETEDLSLFVDGGSLAFPTTGGNPGTAGQKGFIDGTAGGTLDRRPIANVDSRVLGEEAWFTALIRKDEASDVRMVLGSTAGGSGNRRTVIFDLDTDMALNMFNAFAEGGQAVPVDETFLFIGRYAAEAGQIIDGGQKDLLQAAIYEAGEALPTTAAEVAWDLVEDRDNTARQFSQFYIEVNGGRTEIDEIRYGRSFDDVLGSGTPEFVESFDYDPGNEALPIVNATDWEARGANSVISVDDSGLSIINDFSNQDLTFIAEVSASTLSGAGTDVVNIEVLENGQAFPTDNSAIPGGWDFTFEGESAALLSKLRLSSIGGTARIDAVRVGTTLASVADRTFDATPTIGCDGDLNGDGSEDFLDVLSLLALIDEGGSAGDVNGDGFSDNMDIMSLFAAFDPGCE